MKIRNNRFFGYAVIFVAYLLAGFAGIALYQLLPFPAWLSLLLADVIATILVFVFSVVCDNASVYDPYWSVQPIVITLAYAISEGVNASGALMLIAVCFWGVRLTANWAYTFLGLQFQDWRYTMLKEKTGRLYPLVNFFGIHLVPTLVVYACVLPVVYVVLQAPTLNAGLCIFTAMSILAAIMQGIADIQMHKFRKSKVGGFIRSGLWKYSRHPNYLGEIVMWWGIGLGMVCVLPSSWYLLLGAVLNTLLFVFISIPMAEKRQSRKAGFEEYKAQTRVLLPLKK